ncbi:MAG TPA: HlyD family efflux transporter periplasmic adaptor subunit [Bacteroidales bacterium]|nr:HlyD family efflux transporter periplasmic adaptor subunit [Bacteroidales bacterium]
MAEINKSEIRSPELQEVMSEIPGSFLRWGLFLFFGIVVAILAISWFISSPDIVTAPLTVTTLNPPASLVARSGGKIERFFVQNGDNIPENQEVAIIGNQARWEDLRLVEEFIGNSGESVKWETLKTTVVPTSGLTLGEIQDPWLRFTGLLRKFREYTIQSYIPSKLDLLDKQIARQEEYIREMKNQELLSEEDLRLAYNSYKRDSNLFHRSSYSISVNEFEHSRQEFLQKQVSFSALRSSIKNNESSILKMRETKLDLTIQFEKEKSQLISDLNESLQLLKVSLGQWKEKYLILSPVKGRITFTSFWSMNQIINSGEALATVVPDDPKRILIRARVPVSGSGRVRQGQDVNIKLSGYPYMENGVLKGRITALSLVPVDDVYIADIELTNGMKTSYGLDLDFINGMTGTAEIITESKRLIFRFIKPLRKVIG